MINIFVCLVGFAIVSCGKQEFDSSTTSMDPASVLNVIQLSDLVSLHPSHLAELQNHPGIVAHLLDGISQKIDQLALWVHDLSHQVLEPVHHVLNPAYQKEVDPIAQQLDLLKAYVIEHWQSLTHLTAEKFEALQKYHGVQGRALRLPTSPSSF